MEQPMEQPKKISKIFSFDIGIASIGWAFREKRVKNDESYEIEIKDCGVRIFTKAENPKTGESLALPRREARSKRRRFARRKGRLNTLKQLICSQFKLEINDYLSIDGELPKAYTASKTNKLESPYALRERALRKRLDPRDLARVILHIAKHRGYNHARMKESWDTQEENKDQTTKTKKNKQQESTTQDKEKMKTAIKANKENIEKYESVGAYLYKEFFEVKKEDGSNNFKNVRNRDGNYVNCMLQDWLKDELDLILERQKDYGVEFSPGFKDKILKKAFEQRPLKGFEKLVGECQFYEGEKRAAKNSLSALEFIALTRIINTLKDIEKKKGELYAREEFQANIKNILDIVLEQGVMTYAKLREILNLDEKIYFGDPKLNYEEKIKNAEKANFIDFKHLIEFKKALGESFGTLKREYLDEIATHITLTKDRVELEKKLKNLKDIPLDKQQIKALSMLDLCDHIKLSFKALKKILPGMREGLTYDEACERENLQPRRQKTKKGKHLPPLEEYDPYLTNPVVKRALSEYRKVLNSLLKEYGIAHKIVIEFTRDIAVSAKEKARIKKEQSENNNKNNIAAGKCEEIGLKPYGNDLVKVKLWLEQKEYCIYSGEKIRIDDLKLDSQRPVEIDHIYPYSRSLDDSLINKVLVFRSENQNKSNKTPFEAFGGDEKKWANILHLTENLPAKKRNRIRDEKFKDKEKEFKQRNLNDTSYIAILARDYTDHYLEFLPLEEGEDTNLSYGMKGAKAHIETVSGRITTTMRHYFGIGNKNRKSHLHHAEDAMILAFIDRKIIHKFVEFKKAQEECRDKLLAKKISESDLKSKNKNIWEHSLDKMGLKIKNIRDSIDKKLESIFVSKPPRRKVKGELHKETYRSIYLNILGEWEVKTSNTTFNGKDNILKALKYGKIRRLNNLHRDPAIGDKIVENGEMVRVDIFYKNGKFYGVPIYTMDFAIGVLPNRAVVVGGKVKNSVMKDWLYMDESFEFKFSLFKDDLILIQKKKMEKPELCYYEGFDSATASISVAYHSNTLIEPTLNQQLLFPKATDQEVKASGIGIQGLKVFKKMRVSILGKMQEEHFFAREKICKSKSSKGNKKSKD